MGQLKNAIEKNDIKTVQRIVADKELDLLGDPFIALYLEDLLRTVRLTALVSLVAPYKTVKLDFLARKMNVDVQHIRSLLSELILEERIEGQIDQVKNVLELASSDTIVADKHRAMSAWGDKLLSVHKELLRKVNDK
jgi:COP9 signalosome complex subunit 2